MSDIQLFRIDNGKAAELKGYASDLEKPLQSLIEANLEPLLGIRFLATEYSTGKTHAGRIDSLGLDENNCPVILEYKRSASENVINQGLFYLDWLMDHKKDFLWLVMDKLGKESVTVIRSMAAQLDLEAPQRARHNERDGIVAFASALAALTGSLGKIGQDIALMVQTEVGEAKLASGGGSSAMPHKSNPVGAEVLVTLARFNATLVAGMHQALVHENERSGAAWTLEWMLLPQIAVAAGAALNTASELIAGLEILPLKS